MESIDHIYRDGRQYDRLFAGSNQDLPFWIGRAHACGGPILELACGTGRLTIPLAKAGYMLTGIDNSQAMLAEAHRKAAEAAVPVALVHTDVREFDVGQQFALIIFPANALCHLLARKDFEACLASVRRHLQDAGKLVIDVFVPKLERLVNQPGARFPFAEYEDPDGRGRIVMTESYVYEPDTQIKHITTYAAMPGQGAEVVGALNMRMYFPQELDALIRYNGFVIEAKYGDYQLSTFDAQSEKQLVVCSVVR